MKKHQIVATVGTLALVANLLLPNLAFGQQVASQPVGCPTTPGSQSWGRTPTDTTLTALTAGLGGNSVDSTLGAAATEVPGVNVLSIWDNTSTGAEGCSTVGGSVTASATDFTDSTNPSAWFSSDKLRLVTTANVAKDADYNHEFSDSGVYGRTAATTPEVTSGVIYDRASGAPGDLHDVEVPQNTDLTTNTLDDKSTLAAYKLASTTQNTFGSGVSIDVLRYCTSKNSVFGAGVALAVDSVAASQTSGNYQSTITYTKAPLNCVGMAATTMTSSITATAMTMDVASAMAITPASYIAVGGEYMQVTAVQDNTTYYTLSVDRAQLGTTASAYNAGQTVSVVGYATFDSTSNQYVTTSQAVDGGSMRTIQYADAATLALANFQVNQTLISTVAANGGYEHMRVTAVNTDSITVDRGVDNTGAYRGSYNAGLVLIKLAQRPS